MKTVRVPRARKNNPAASFLDEQEKFQNRVLFCLAISPVGRLLKVFHSVLESLGAFRDAIKAHRSLFLNGKILHRDIYSNNIVITDPGDADSSSGMLIDVDLATRVKEYWTSEQSEAQQMTAHYSL